VGQTGCQKIQVKIGEIFQTSFSGGRGLRTGLKMVCLERELNSAHQENLSDRNWVKIEKSSKIDQIMPKSEEGKNVICQVIL
jgi:hypothetical protein